MGEHTCDILSGRGAFGLADLSNGTRMVSERCLVRPAVKRGMAVCSDIQVGCFPINVLYSASV